MKIAAYLNVNGVKVSTSSPEVITISPVRIDNKMNELLMVMHRIKQTEDQIIIDTLGITHEQYGSLKEN